MPAPFRFGLATVFCAIFLLGGAPGVSPALAAPERIESEAAIIFVRLMVKQTLAIQNDIETPLEMRREKIQHLLRDLIATKTIGKFLVGRYWREMTSEQKTRYQDLFRQWVVDKYALQLAEASGYAVEVLGTTPAGKRDLFVRTRISRPEGKEPVTVDWRLRNSRDKVKIIDIVIEGISMLVTQKSEFNTILRSKGVDHLITILAGQTNEAVRKTRSHSS